MNDYKIKNMMTKTDSYRDNFQNYLRGNDPAAVHLKDGMQTETGSYAFPDMSASRCDSAISAKSVIRRLATVYSSFTGASQILAADSDDIVSFVAEGYPIPVKDTANDFTKITVGRYKLASILRMTTEFATDAAFDLESFLTKRIGRAFAGAEDKAFITGTGTNEPTGILHSTAGAETGVTTASLTFEKVIELFFSVDKKYREDAVWLMNDSTAEALRKLQDDNGNYLWNHFNDTILGKKVFISEYMPDADAGECPIAFGDFSYYWIIRRSPVSVKVLRELYSLTGRIGYMIFEFLDGKLVRRDAVKVLKLSE